MKFSPYVWKKKKNSYKHDLNLKLFTIQSLIKAFNQQRVLECYKVVYRAYSVGEDRGDGVRGLGMRG